MKLFADAGKMELDRLFLGNFKGQRSLELAPNGGDLEIFGDNAAGKTTIADAFFWLLFDKDSANRKDFEIKTLGPDGQPIHHLEHEVFGAFRIGGEEITLKKLYKESWVTKRGSANKEFSGHTTSYEVDGVPRSKGEYDAAIAAICDEKRFRLLSDPTYFNQTLHWQERRKLLLEICGDMSDEEVIQLNADLAGLPEILGRHTLDDYRKILKSRRTAIAKEKEEIPARINELKRQLGSSAPDDDIQDAADIEAEIRELNEQRARINAGGEVAEKQKQLREIEAAIIEATNKAKNAAMAGGDTARRALTAAENNLAAAESQALGFRTEIETLKGSVRRDDAELSELRSQYTAEEQTSFSWTGTDTCGACGQSLPEDQVFQARANAEAIFNKAKASKLERIKADGMRKREVRDSLLQTIQTKEERLAEIEAELPELTNRRNAMKAALDKASESLEPADDAEINRLRGEAMEIEQAIRDLRRGVSDSLADVDDKIAGKRELLQRIQEAKAKIAAQAAAESRLEELLAREKELAGELEKIDAETFLSEEFIRTKVAGLEERINSRFTIARFKLFDNQVNGGLQEVCETAVDGVPYSSLNHGARLNVGLDIINVLSDHFGFAPPVIIDNAESVTRILPTLGQQIRLIVSAADKTLRVVSGAGAQPRKEPALL